MFKYNKFHYLNVILVDLAEELVAAQSAEPGYPTHFLGAKTNVS